MSPLPLGQKEDPRLEFKGRDSLKTPEDIAREVVAMLNAEGGEIWVGLREDEGRAVAVESIDNADREVRRLLDSLVDSIEPSLSGGELQVKVVEEDGSPVLRILVKPSPGQRPYALLRRGGRHFVTRIADRIRPLSREEIRGFFQELGTNRATALQKAVERVFADRKSAATKRQALFWLRLEPAADIKIDVQAAEVRDLFREPSLSGNRNSGWSFAHLHSLPVLSTGRLANDPSSPRHVEIRRDGSLLFQAFLESLQWKGEDIWPFVLLEYPISAFRIARKLYEGKMNTDDTVVADLALFGLRGRKLRPGSPGTWFSSNRARIFNEADDFLLDSPLVFKAEEIESEPDRCGFRLVERVYEAFGLGREAIPREFDQEVGRLILPE
jgi:hypothetical protein